MFFLGFNGLGGVCVWWVYLLELNGNLQFIVMRRYFAAAISVFIGLIKSSVFIRLIKSSVFIRLIKSSVFIRLIKSDGSVLLFCLLLGFIVLFLSCVEGI